MKALITGASSGLGMEMAKYLNKLNYDLILVARRKEKLEIIKKELKRNVKIISVDLSDEDACLQLYQAVTDDKIDVLINCAGFGIHGEFAHTDLRRELEMIDINIKTTHILTKLFLKDMKKRNHGYIMNVASLAAFQAGPLMASYYATKAYILRMTMAIYEELRRNKINVKVSVLCPGPVDTEFNDIAKVKFSTKPLSSQFVAKYAVDRMLKDKLIIIPGFKYKISYYFSKVLSLKRLLRITYSIQKKKIK
jgi:uncharacterized protein